MSLINIITPFNIDLEFQVAPFHKRLIAWMVDILPVYLYMFFVERYIVTPLAFYESLGQTASILLIMVPAYCYHLLCEVFMNGQSMGKRMVGIRVMDLSGYEASLSQYLIRWSFRLVDVVLTLGSGAVLSVALSKNSQRIGDMLAGTVVIDERARTSADETIYLDLETENYVPLYPQVLRLSDRDINGIRNLLRAEGGSRDNDLYRFQVALRITEVLNIETEQEPRAFLEQLLKDYNFLTRK